MCHHGSVQMLVNCIKKLHKLCKCMTLLNIQVIQHGYFLAVHLSHSVLLLTHISLLYPMKVQLLACLSKLPLGSLKFILRHVDQLLSNGHC